MKSIAICEALVLLAAPCFASKKLRSTVTAQSYRIVPHSSSIDLPVYGSVETTCYGSGKGWNYVNCSSYVYPAGDIPLGFSWATIYNEVSDGHIIYTLKCSALRKTGSCQWLKPGDKFDAEIGRDYVWIYGRRLDTDKTSVMKFYIDGETCVSNHEPIGTMKSHASFWRNGTSVSLPPPGSHVCQ